MGSRGISLLEVLIAIFVTAIGLLGVAALIPIGTFQVGEATKSIRAWDVAQIAYHEVRIRNMLDSDMWLDATGAVPDLATTFPPVAFAIDPYFFARNAGIITMTGYAPGRTGANERHPQPFPLVTGTAHESEYFPYRSQNDVVPAGPLPGALQMPRMTLRRRPGGTFPLPSILAERIFSGQDDLIFTIPSDPQLRSYPLNMVETYTDSDGNNQWDPGEPLTDLNDNGIWDDYSSIQPTAGDYSWMLTAAPSTPWIPGLNSYTLSIVVCYKRPANFAPIATTPGERTVYADLLDGTRDGGRSVRLHYSTTDEEAPYLNLKSGSWIMLSGNLNPLRNAGITTPLFRWYRVLSVGELEPDASGYSYGPGTVYGRLVTLDGPDLDAFAPNSAQAVNQNRFIDNYPGVNSPDAIPTFYATLVDGVVNVFERTIEFDR